jgi:hypothetical protein
MAAGRMVRPCSYPTVVGLAPAWSPAKGHSQGAANAAKPRFFVEHWPQCAAQSPHRVSFDASRNKLCGDEDPCVISATRKQIRRARRRAHDAVTQTRVVQIALRTARSYERSPCDEGGPAFDALWLFRNIVRMLLSDFSMGSDLDVSLTMLPLLPNRRRHDYLNTRFAVNGTWARFT